MRRSVLVLVLLLGCQGSPPPPPTESKASPPKAAPAAAPDAGPAREEKPKAPDLHWNPDPVAALADAQKQQRATIVIFCAKWNKPCEDLDRTLVDPSVQAILTDHFVGARVDMSTPRPGVEKTYDIHALPTMIIFDRAGKEVARQIGGNMDVKTFTTLLARAG